MSMDEAGEVRRGEELDFGALIAYLGEHAPAVQGPFTVRQFLGGHSNLTYLIQGAEAELVLRRAPPGVSIKSAHDMGREFRILGGLAKVWNKTPVPIALCEDVDVLGSSFYVMHRVRGSILRRSRQGAELGLDNPAAMTTLSRHLVDTLAEIHGLDVQAAGLTDLGKPEGYVARQVAGWSARYARAKTDNIPEVETLIEWLKNHQPPEVAGCLIHNDLKYDNVVLDLEDATRIVGVLDWEMATLGDPLMDLGTTLGYWLDPDDPPMVKKLKLGSTTLAGNLTRSQVVERYAAATGRDLSHILFYYVFALFKVCGIAQQLHARLQAGLTQDARFEMMIDGVRTFSELGVRAIEANRIDRLG